MLAFAVFLGLSLLVWSSNALKDISERGRSGSFYKELLKKKNKLQANIAAPFVWQAPVDHFNQSNTETFNQRYI
jgi:hypothetical protein